MQQEPPRALGFQRYYNITIMPKPRHPDGPKVNAGISLRQKTEIKELKEFAKIAGFDSVSAVVSFLIKEYLPIAMKKIKSTKKAKESESCQKQD